MLLFRMHRYWQQKPAYSPVSFIYGIFFYYQMIPKIISFNHLVNKYMHLAKNNIQNRKQKQKIGAK